MKGMDAPASFHGHDVLNLLLKAVEPLSLEEIHEEVTQHFGAGARFHTCSSEGFDAEALIAFFLQRGKIMQIEGGFAVNGSRICQH